MKARIPMAAALFAVIACENAGRTSAEGPKDKAPPAPVAAKVDADAPTKRVVQPPIKAENAPPATPRLPALPPQDQLLKAVQSYFEGHVGRHIYVQVDKPLYKPAETIWIKTWDLRSKDLGGQATGSHRYDLVSPRGSVVMTKNVQVERGMGTNDFTLPEEIEGGEYTLRVTSPDGVSEERPLIVSAYEAPRFKKKLEFVRKAYGAGDEVAATIKVERPTGEPFANQPLRGTIWLDGEALEPVKATTNAEGGGMLRFKLPAKIERGDGLLTVLVDDGGITESVSKRIPIIVKKLELSFYPEGGQLVTSLPTRLYFEAKNPLGKPADIEGRIVDDHGSPVATFTSYHDGLGRFDFTPGTGRTYAAEIIKPVGVTEKYPLPLASEQGCVLHTYDDLDSQLSAIRVGVRCSSAKKVVVAAVLRENLLDAASLDVAEGSEAVAYLEPKEDSMKRAQGIARVTLFDESLHPMTERLIYRNRRSSLQVKVTPDRPAYSPREQVALTVETSDEKGAPVPAELAVSVVDDTVVSFADDKTGHLLSRMFLEREIPGKVEEPKPYFDLTEPKSALAMDLLMGTRGWRRFDWTTVFVPPTPRPVATGGGGPAQILGAGAPRAAEVMPEEIAKNQAGPRVDRGPGRGAGVRARAPAVAAVAAPPPMPMAGEAVPAKPAVRDEEAKPQDEAVAQRPRRALAALEAKADRRQAKERVVAEFGDKLEEQERPPAEPPAQAAPDLQAELGKVGRLENRAIAPVRVFPAPAYRGDEPSTRTDFRETIHWAPSVLIGKSGRATITFYVSDAITSFRVFAEGAGAGLLGRAEHTFKSSLPFSMDVKLPLEVSAGDKLELPLTLTNDKDKELQLSLTTSFGELLKLDREVAFSGSLPPSKRASLFYPITVTGRSGKSKVSFSAGAGGLTDEFSREVNVVPLGFPQTLAQSGTLKERARHSFDLGQAIEGSGEVTLKLYPSPVATIVSGLEGMIREPSGCFEQTSSTNYPNVMVLDYLRENDVADPALVERVSGMLERGYKKLVGFETPNKGYEWFGRAPANEALTAYGLVEFVDMKRVTGSVDDEMLARTAKYIAGRRDGKGGFLRDPQALDSFGRASAEVTDAYIVWSLTEAGFFDFAPEIERMSSLAETTKDEYLLSLAVNALLNVPAKRERGIALAKRLGSLQDKEGAWSRADHSITRSTGINLQIETTSLALIALMKVGRGYEEHVRAGIQWLAGHRGGFGEWGATQATVLALRAMTTYAKLSRRTPGAGTIVVRVNGEEAAKKSYEAGHKDAIEVTGLGRLLKAGSNEIELIHDGKAELPYTIGIELRSLKPATAPDVVVDLSTKLEKKALKMGETVRLTAVVKNKTDQGQPMTIARIGLPGGLTFQNWQLKELREKGDIAFFETRAREVILYFRELRPGETKDIGIDLVAMVPGHYTGPASSAYLYYTNDKRVWVDPLEVGITSNGSL